MYQLDDRYECFKTPLSVNLNSSDMMARQSKSASRSSSSKTARSEFPMSIHRPHSKTLSSRSSVRPLTKPENPRNSFRPSSSHSSLQAISFSTISCGISMRMEMRSLLRKSLRPPSLSPKLLQPR